MERPSASGGIFMMYPVACVVCVVVVAGVCVVVVVVVVVDELDRTVVVVVEVNVVVEAEDDDDAGEVVDGVDMVMEKLMPSLDLFPPKSHLEKSFFSLSRGRFMTWCRESSGL